jgi:D-amino peptidase
MDFMIGVDCDGPACVVGQPGKTLSFSCDYGFARRQATREADAAARALLDAGAGRVVVWDNHGAGANLEYDHLDDRCEIALGAGFDGRWPGLDATFSGVLMIGYHAMEGTPQGVLAHTYSPGAYRCIRVNDTEVGEMPLDAAVAGAHGVPALLVASDDHGCAEARRFMPWIETVETKRGLGRNVAFSKHPVRAAREVYDATRRAVERLEEMQPFGFEKPTEVEIRFKRPHQALKARLRRPGWRLASLWEIHRRLDDFTQWRC